MVMLETFHCELPEPEGSTTSSQISQAGLMGYSSLTQ